VVLDGECSIYLYSYIECILNLNYEFQRRISCLSKTLERIS
jgi:hypothetical protein